MTPVFNIDLLYRKDGNNKIVSMERSPSLIGCEAGKRLQYILMPGSTLDIRSNSDRVALVVKHTPKVRDYGSNKNVKFHARRFGLNVIANENSYIRILEIKIDVSAIPKWYKNVIVSISRNEGMRYMLLDLSSVGEDGIFKGYILDMLGSVKTTRMTAEKLGVDFSNYPNTKIYRWDKSHRHHFINRQITGVYLERATRKIGSLSGLLNTTYLPEFAKGDKHINPSLNYSTL